VNRRLIFSIVMILLITAAIGCSTKKINSGITSNQQQGIWVNGQGKVATVPDVVQLTLGVQSQRETVAAAQSEANSAMERVIASLTGNGVAEKDIQTQRFSIQIVTRYDDTNKKDVIVGYLVTNMVTAKIRNLDNTGTIIDAIATAGGELTRVDNINFSIEDPAVYYAEARLKAINDAKTRAGQIASLSGIKLGEPTFISESVSIPSSVPPVRVGTPAPGQTPISIGEVNVTITVQIVFAILK
jgi:uncharacterized protein